MGTSEYKNLLRKTPVPYALVPCGLLLGVLLAGVAELSCHNALLVSHPTWVHVAEVDPLRGGMPTAISAVTVEANGEIQVSQETDRDEILALRELQSDTASLFAELERIARSIPSSPKHREQEAEFLPARLRVAIGGRGRAILWEGFRSEAPGEVLSVLKLVRTTIQQSRPSAPPSGHIFLRAGLLPPEVSRQFHKDGLIHDAKQQELNPCLVPVVQHPFLLIPIAEQENPFLPFYKQFVPTRSTLELSVEGTIYQVRSFVRHEGEK